MAERSESGEAALWAASSPLERAWNLLRRVAGEDAYSEAKATGQIIVHPLEADGWDPKAFFIVRNHYIDEWIEHTPVCTYCIVPAFGVRPRFDNPHRFAYIGGQEPVVEELRGPDHLLTLWMIARFSPLEVSRVGISHAYGLGLGAAPAPLRLVPIFQRIELDVR